jgi:ribosome biogenesis protein Nip4
MQYKANCAIAFQGDRVERGAIVDMTKAEAQRYGDDLVPFVDQVEAEAVVKDVPIEEMTYAQLQARAKELDLSASGSKADLEERIRLHLEGTDSTEEELEVDDNEVSDSTEEEELADDNQ